MNHANPSKETKMPHFMHEALFEHSQIACTKRFTTELIDISRLKDLNKKKIQELLYLLIFGILEAKYDLGRTGEKYR